MENILFGDNQFFGVNHMSEEKARQQAMRFQDLDAIMQVLEAARDFGAGGFMCTTHDRIADVADRMRSEAEAWEDFKMYPCMPYAHKYANAVTEFGYFDALRKALPKEGLVDTLLRSSKAIATQDMKAMIGLLIDAEMKMFDGLKTPIIFLQNVVTDLVVGLRAVEALRAFAEHVQHKYNADPGFITMNVPMLLPLLDEAGVKNPVVCANVNKIGFRMSGGIEAYRQAAETYSPRVVAMSIFASGAISPRAAIDWVLEEPYVHSIVFGASSNGNIETTIRLIREKREAQAANPSRPPRIQ
ncbi:MAG: hypothetical protein ABR588_08315 [Sphingomicrobium sp.]|nr:hypothetical protein [Sphingomonadales bacterium]